jgi:hypothetical protein
MQIAAKRKIKRKAITEEAKRQTVVNAHVCFITICLNISLYL